MPPGFMNAITGVSPPVDHRRVVELRVGDQVTERGLAAARSACASTSPVMWPIDRSAIGATSVL